MEKGGRWSEDRPCRPAAKLAFGRRGSAPRAVPSAPGSTVSPAGRTTKTLHPKGRKAGLCPGSPSASSLRARGSFFVLSQREPDGFGPRLASGTRAPEQVPPSLWQRGRLGLDATPGRKGRATKSQGVWTSQGQCPEPYTPSRDTSPRTGVGHPAVPPHSPAPHQLHLPGGRGLPWDSWVSCPPEPIPDSPGGGKQLLGQEHCLGAGGMNKKGTKEPLFLTPRHGKNSASVCVPNTGEKALRAGFGLAFRRC